MLTIDKAQTDEIIDGLFGNNNLTASPAVWYGLHQIKTLHVTEIITCGECKHFQCNMRFDGYVPKGADAYECRRGCGGCDPMDYCSYGKRREGRTE